MPSVIMRLLRLFKSSIFCGNATGDVADNKEEEEQDKGLPRKPVVPEEGLDRKNSTSSNQSARNTMAVLLNSTESKRKMERNNSKTVTSVAVDILQVVPKPMSVPVQKLNIPATVAEDGVSYSSPISTPASKYHTSKPASERTRVLRNNYKKQRSFDELRKIDESYDVPKPLNRKILNSDRNGLESSKDQVHYANFRLNDGEDHCRTIKYTSVEMLPLTDGKGSYGPGRFKSNTFSASSSGSLNSCTPNATTYNQIDFERTKALSRVRAPMSQYKQMSILPPPGC